MACRAVLALEGLGRRVKQWAALRTVGVNVWVPLTTTEKSLIVLGLVGWLLITLHTAPPFGSTDVYLFRDAAYNLVHGGGFTTAVGSDSPKFDRALFSSYTPGSVWLFLPFVAAIRNGPWAAQVYYLAFAIFVDFAALMLIVRRVSPGWERLLAICLLAASLPAGYLGAALDRPENLSLLALIVLLLNLRGRRTASGLFFSGLIAGCAFLAEPFAGVLGAFLVAGAIALDHRRETFRHRARLVLSRGLVSGLALIAPIVVVAASLQLRDPQSLRRFARHALITGGLAPLRQGRIVVRTSAPLGADVAPTTGSWGASVARTLRFYRSAVYFQLGDSIGKLVLAVTLAIAIIWLILCLRGGTNSPRLPLVVLGLILFVFPFGVFPRQGNYLLLSRCLFPFALATNWAGSGYCLRSSKPIGLLLSLNLFLACVPLPFTTLMRFENRESYREAGRQVAALEAYLNSHALREGIVLVPAGQYYLYKSRIDNIFDPEYLEPHDDGSRIVGVVSCNTASRYFSARSKPLPDLVAKQRWRVLTAAQHQVTVTLFHRRVMHSNWTWACDIYVPEDPGFGG